MKELVKNAVETLNAFNYQSELIPVVIANCDNAQAFKPLLIVLNRLGKNKVDEVIYFIETLEDFTGMQGAELLENAMYELELITDHIAVHTTANGWQHCENFPDKYQFDDFWD